MKHSRLLSSSSTAFLQQKLQLRAPYVAPLHILQVGARCTVMMRAGCALVSMGTGWKVAVAGEAPGVEALPPRCLLWFD